jgi:spore germination protein
MFNDNDKISTRETAIFTFSSLIEVGTLMAVRILGQHAGPDAWLSFCLAYVFSLPGIFILIRLGQRFYRHGFVEYSRIIVGTVIGWILSAILVAYWVFLSARILRVAIGVIKMSLLDRTPAGVIAFGFLLLTVYLCWHGIEPLCRMSMLIVISIIPATLILSLAVFGKLKIDNFLPFMAEGPLPVLKAAIIGMGYFGELTFFFFLVPFMKRPERAAKAAFSGSFAMLLYKLYIIILTMGVLGADLVNLRMVPVLTVAEVAEFPGIFVERLSVVFTGLWIILVFPTTCGLLYASATTLSQMFGRKNHRLFLILLVPLIYFISNIPQNTLQAENFFKFLMPYGIVMLTVLPLLLYIIAIIRDVKDE